MMDGSEESNNKPAMLGSEAITLHTKAHICDDATTASKTPVLEERLRPSHLKFYRSLKYSEPDLSELQPQDCALARAEDSYIVGDSSLILEVPDGVDVKFNSKSPVFVSNLILAQKDKGDLFTLNNCLNKGEEGRKSSVEEKDRSNENSKNHSDTKDEAESKGSNAPQFFAALAANCGSIALGTVLSWTATALPDLRERKSLGDITQFSESWIGSIALLGAAAACPIVGFAIERLGRRKTMLFLTTPFVAGWLLICFAQHLAMIYAGRFMTGFCGGGFSLLIPVYITETSTANVRGALTSGFDMMLTVGILYIFFLGSYLSWRWQAAVCALVPIVFHLLMFFAPESPRYLVEKEKEAEARKALCWLRGTSSQQVETELCQLSDSVEKSKGTQGSWRDLFTMEVFRPTFIGLVLMLNQQLSGIDAIMFYTVDIFKSAGSNINENLATIIVGAIQVLATLTSAAVVDRCGRRFLLMLSEVFMVLSLGTMGLYFHLKKLNHEQPPESLGWLPLTSLLVYVVAFSIGFGPTPWIIAAEILPPKVKGQCYGLVAITRWLLGFGVTIVFQDIMHVFGEDGGYWFFASCCFLGGFYVWFAVPETNGKTLDEIQEYFNKSNKTASNNATSDEEKKQENPSTNL